MDLQDLHYEMLVEFFQADIDPQLAFFSLFDSAIEPNALHFFIARAVTGTKPHLVMTTNFDYLLEIAMGKVASQRQQVVPVITRQDFERWADPARLLEAGRIPVYKLHGSKRNVITGKDTGSSIVTTLTALAKDRADGKLFAIEPYKRPAMVHLTRGRHIVVLGYSGADAFDIIPTLREIGNIGKITWINHIGGLAPRVFKTARAGDDGAGTGVARVQPERIPADELLLELGSKDVDVARIDVDSGEFISSLWEEWFPDVPIPAVPGKGEQPQVVSTDERSVESMRLVRDMYSSVDDLQKWTLAWDCYNAMGDVKSAERCATNGLVLARKNKSPRFTSFFSWSLGEIGLAREEYTEARRYLDEALAVAEGNGLVDEASHVHALIGDWYRANFQLEDAMQCYERAYRLNVKRNNLAGQASCLNRLGIVFQETKAPDKALDAYEKALRLEAQLGNMSARAALLHNKGRLLEGQDRTPEALEAFTEALKVSELLGDLSAVYQEADNIAMVHYERGDFEKAVPFLKKTIETGDKLGPRDEAFTQYEQGITHVLDYLGNCYSKLGLWKAAFGCYDRALSIDQELGFPESIAFDLKQLGVLHVNMGDHDVAVTYLKRALQAANAGKNAKQVAEIEDLLNRLDRNAS